MQGYGLNLSGAGWGQVESSSEDGNGTSCPRRGGGEGGGDP
jgi:hypothetical protein